MDSIASRRAKTALSAMFAVFIAFLYMPILVLALFSFNDDPVPAFPLSGFTTRWYAELMENGELVASVLTSAKIAAITSVLSVALALMASAGLAAGRWRGRWSGAFQALFVLPLVVPVIVLGVAMFVLFRRLEVELGYETVVAGHVVVAFPYCLLVLLPRLRRLDPSLVEAARDLGASSIRASWAVTLPLMTPAVVSATLVAFVISFDEFAVSSFLAGSDTTFPLYLVSQLRFPDRLPQVMAVAVLVILASSLLFIAAEVGRRRSERQWEGTPR